VSHVRHDVDVSTALNTIKELTGSGVELWREGDQIRYGAIEGTLTTPDMHWLANNKALLLQMLSQGDPERCLPGTPVERSIVVLGRGNLNRHVACVHAIDGSASCYFDLARELTRQGIGTYGIHSLDLHQKKAVPTTIPPSHPNTWIN
jgi:hypothetical protein